MTTKKTRDYEAALIATANPVPPAKPFSRHAYARKVKWHPVEIPQAVADARARYPIRHLGDLLLITGIPWSTAAGWYRGQPAKSIENVNHRIAASKGKNAKGPLRYVRPPSPRTRNGGQLVAVCPSRATMT